MDWDNYDIMSVVDNDKTSNDFRLTFDLHTPRPHFVIVSRRHRCCKDEADLDQPYLIQALQLALDATYTLKLPSSVISIHRGSWVTMRDKFYMNLCTDTQKYVDIFQELSNIPPMNNWWPSTDFVNRDWVPHKDPRNYIDNVCLAPFMSYRTYEVYDIKNWIASNGDTESELCEVFEGRQIVFHQYKSQIGLSGEVCYDKPGSILEIIQQLNRFAQILKVDDFHICVELTGKGFHGFKTGEAVFAYLQVPGTVFYSKCPYDCRKDWLAEYNETEGKIYT